MDWDERFRLFSDLMMKRFLSFLCNSSGLLSHKKDYILSASQNSLACIQEIAEYLRIMLLREQDTLRYNNDR